ncbi:MAG: hypothetical protein Q4C50_08670 [Eubacteriales bacterium]|nr:hypothetical protein [Eubacteriales bacterium]
MRLMLAVRDSLGRFYGKYDTLLRLLFKFLLAFTAFTAIGVALGQTPVLKQPVILAALAAACMFLPSNSILLIGAGLIMGHFYGISAEAAIVGGGVLVIAILLYFCISPRSALPLILTALAMPLGLGCVPAVLFGLVGGPLSAVGVAFGAMTYYLVRIVARTGGSLTAASAEAAEAMVQRSAELIQNILSEKEMPLMMAALALVLLVVYFIRTLAIRYAWLIAAGAGCLVYLILRIVAAAMGIALEPLGILLEIAVCMAAAWTAQVMLFSLDYKKTENVRFEDDEYYYYVKVVPKQKIRRRKRRRRSEGR